MVPLFDSSNKHDFSLLSLVHDIHQNIFLVWYSMTPPPPDLKKIINFDDPKNPSQGSEKERCHVTFFPVGKFLTNFLAEMDHYDKKTIFFALRRQKNVLALDCTIFVSLSH